MIRLLTVCTGNICRSPFAERMLQTELESLHPGLFQVRSAGTGALVGNGMEDQSAALLASFGGSSEGFASRQLVPALLADTDLVLAMTVAHRGAVVQMSPRLLKRSYTLVELGRILRTIRRSGTDRVKTGNSPEQVRQRWQQLPVLAAEFRSQSKPSTAGDDVVDPYRRSSLTHQQMVEEILPAMEEILAFERWYGNQG
ncbi:MULTISPECIES: low molecular weight phosphatase family protein [unclassified Arthrobacter]|uniref:arsenate reductase/protein-tyrosine-phosphatase family protein n=1 Tax=unclassified Arthrobacter TaxID=235627 RepID=UPI000CE383B1|nr:MULTISPECIES: low molecular weight phosphatase family protein [unclassified Arthrobacter]